MDIQQKNTKFQDTVTQIYVILFFCYLLVSKVIPVSYMLSGTIDTILSSVFAGIGTLLIFIDLFTQRHLFKNRNSKILILFVVVVAISSAINIKYGCTDNIKTMVWMCIQMFLIYSLFTKFDNEKSEKLLKILINIMSVIWFVCVVISIIQFCLQIGYLAPETESILKRQGFYDNRLFGIFIDPNFAAIISMCIVFFDLYAYGTVTNIFIKIFYVMSVVIQYIYIILSGSRTVVICFFAGIILGVGLYIRNYCIRKHMSTKQWIYKEIVALIVVCLLFGIMYMVSRQLLSYVPMLGGNKAKENKTHAEEILKREDVKEDNMLNNRGTIWKEYVKSLDKKEYIIGLSPRNAINCLEQRYPDGYVAKTKYTPHSDYVALFIYTGGIGCAVILMFYLMTAAEVLRIIRKKRVCSCLYITSLTVAASLIIYGIAFLDIYFVNTITAFIFWLMMSIIQKSNNQ